MYRVSAFAMTAVLAAAVLAGAPARATEAAPEASAAALLGADVKGDNWTVAPVVRSDGFLRLYDVQTPYGKFQVNGQRRMNERLQELRALSTLEKMSRTKAFGDALTKAGLAPIRFGRDLILDPVETTGNLVSGVGKMFDNVYSSVSHRDESRDSLFNSATGITAAERELAIQLKVDPYTDFTPLREGLEDVAHVIAAGGLSVNAALMAVPGGAGIAVSATATASELANSIYNKTSIEIAELVSKKLKGLGVDEALAKKFVTNTFYTPADQFAIAEALEKLKAANSTAFITRAAAANSFDVAKFNRWRAELLADDGARLGALKDFTIISDIALNHDGAGRLVAAFPFDNVAWTDGVSKSLTRLNTDVAANGKTQAVVFGTTGTMSAMAETELKKFGWTTAELN